MRVFRGECACFALDHENRHRISSLIFIQQGCSAGGCTQMFSNSREQNIDAGQASPGQRPRREPRARERKKMYASQASPGQRPPRAPIVCVCVRAREKKIRESEQRARCAADRARKTARGAASIEIAFRGDARAPCQPRLPAGRPVLCTLSRPHPAHLAPFVLRRALSVLEDVLSILSTAPHAPRR